MAEAVMVSEPGSIGIIVEAPVEEVPDTAGI
jgi:hypothetical protein